MNELHETRTDSALRLPQFFKSDVLLPPLDKYLSHYATHLQQRYANTTLAPTGNLLQSFLAPEAQYSCPLCSYACSIHVACGFHNACAYRGISDSGAHHLIPTSSCSKMPLNYFPGSPVLGDSVFGLRTFLQAYPPKAGMPKPAGSFCSGPLSPPEPSGLSDNHHQEDHGIRRRIQVCHYQGCGYACNSSFFLERHIANAHRNRPTFKCDRCSFSTREADAYKDHLLGHLGLRPFHRERSPE